MSLEKLLDSEFSRVVIFSEKLDKTKSHNCGHANLKVSRQEMVSNVSALSGDSILILQFHQNFLYSFEY